MLMRDMRRHVILGGSGADGCGGSIQLRLAWSQEATPAPTVSASVGLTAVQARITGAVLCTVQGCCQAAPTLHCVQVRVRAEQLGVFTAALAAVSSISAAAPQAAAQPVPQPQEGDAPPGLVSGVRIPPAIKACQPSHLLLMSAPLST